MNTQSIKLGDWVWDPNTLELRKGAYVVALEPRVARLLEYMLTHPGELLSRDRIVEAVWDGRVVSDEAVRRAVFNLRQAFAAGGDNYIRTIHKKGYVAQFPLSAEPAAPLEPLPTAPARHAVDSAVAQEITAETDLPGRAPSRPLRLYRRVGLLAIVAAVLMYLGVPWFQESDVKHAQIPTHAPASIAVLPFINSSDAPVSEFLTDGLTEELIGKLERNRELRVTARASTFQFRSPERDIQELGRRLGVHYVLEGRVQGDRQGTQVSAQLIDVAAGSQLWAQTYARNLADWFTLQQDIAVDVTRAVQVALRQTEASTAPPGGTSSAEAQLALLRARKLLITRSLEDAEQAIEHLQRALTLDPNYALAYARLADAILIQAESTNSVKVVRPVVEPLLDKALSLDPALGEAYALRSRLTDDSGEAERYLRRGLELNPSYARGYEMLASLHAAAPEQMDEALDSIDHAIALDPLTPGNFHTKASLMMNRGEWQQVVELERHALELNPNFRAAMVQLGTVSAVQGNFAEAITYTEQAIRLDPRATSLRDQLVLMYIAVNDLDSAHAVGSQASDVSLLALLAAEGNIKGAADIIYAEKSGALERFGHEFVSQIVLRQALSDQNFTRARELLITGLPFAESLPSQAIGWYMYAYANLIQLVDASGDATTARHLQQQLEVRMRATEARFPRFALVHHQVRATLLAHAGHGEDACAELEQAYTPAPRLFWKLVINNPGFDRMHTTPCFQALRTRIDAHIAAERVRVEALRRDGRIPDHTAANPVQHSGTGA